MKLREALVVQSPSLALQRAASDEIARMDSLLLRASDAIEALDGVSVETEQLVDDFRAWKESR
jgi:hypothetical protein